jgi:methionine biosynthesis protein MetW
VSGVEIDPRGVEEARQRGVGAVVGDLDEGLPFDGDAFDVAVVNVALHMVYRPRFLVEEALRVAPQVILTFPNFGFWLYRAELSLLGRFPKHSLYGYRWYDTRHIHLFSLADLRDLCRELGVTITQERFTGLKNRRESKIARLAPNLFGRIAAVNIERRS